MTRRDQAYRDQPSLFDAPTPPKLCRDCDPPTSKAGAEHAKKVRREAAAAMIKTYRLADGDLSANEAALRCVAEFGGIQETYRKRAKEIEDDGYIRRCGKRMCQITRMTVRVFRYAKPLKDVGTDGSREDATGATDGTAMEGLQ